MKRCPTCQKTFTDRNLSFCIDDGTPLSLVEETHEPVRDEETAVRPSTESHSSYSSQSPEVMYQPPGGYAPPGTPPGQQSKRRAWPWVLGCLSSLLIVTVGLVITGKVLFPAKREASSVTNNNNLNANFDRQSDSNRNQLNSDSTSTNLNENSSLNAEEMAAPTNESDVLATLTDLEHEWTVANINADKKKLNRILADDYVGKTFDGKTQGKADYLRTIQRDRAIQRWEFEDLKVSLLGDRATLTGVLRLEAQNQRGEVGPLAFRFTDKFVWRDNRWQAVSSDVKQEE